MYLESIENDNYKPLPGGIFNKGFVKAYAKYVGIDEQEALQDYARLIARNEESVEETHPRYRPEVLTDEARTASTLGPTIIFAVIILGLMTGGILFVVSYLKNQPDTLTVSTPNSAGNTTNLATNIGAPETNTAPAPAPDQITLEFKALSEKVSVTSTVDGTLAYDEVTPDLPKTYVAHDGLKVRYYRGFADKVQLTLNGKQIAAPAPPAKGNIEFEINRENIGRVLESGQITPPAAAATPAATAQVTPATTTNTSTPPTATTSPRPATATPKPAFTPLPTPRRTPTPIVVGRSPAPRPSPE